MADKGHRYTMSPPGQQEALHIQAIELPDSPSYISEMPGSEYSPGVHRSSQPPEVLQYKSAEDMRASGLNTMPQPHLLPQRRNPFNLSPFAFGALVSVATALIVGAIIGGSLGATLVKQEHYQAQMPMGTSTSSSRINRPTPTSTPTLSTSSTSPTLTNYTAASPSDVETLYVDCPNLEDTSIEDRSSSSYQVKCGKRIPPGRSDVTTYSASIAYSLEDCINACAQWNWWTTGSYCVAVSWCQDMSYSWNYEGANCWLFNDSSIPFENNATHVVATLI
ncbi:hypothetical protein F4805DRAFT_457500 [Annulohypoxylon moriforme]|nr:hypothetical protein F4805DRAFT_457500 [Annulohypoxylon moriforme]